MVNEQRYTDGRSAGTAAFYVVTATGVMMLPDLLRAGDPFWMQHRAAQAPLFSLA